MAGRGLILSYRSVLAQYRLNRGRARRDSRPACSFRKPATNTECVCLPASGSPVSSFHPARLTSTRTCEDAEVATQGTSPQVRVHTSAAFHAPPPSLVDLMLGVTTPAVAPMAQEGRLSLGTPALPTLRHARTSPLANCSDGGKECADGSISGREAGQGLPGKSVDKADRIMSYCATIMSTRPGSCARSI